MQIVLASAWDPATTSTSLVLMCAHHIQLHISGSSWESMSCTKRSLEEPIDKGSPTHCRQPNQFPARQGFPLGINHKRIFIKSFLGLLPKRSSKVVPPVRVWPFNVPLSKTHSTTLAGAVTVFCAFTGELIFSVLSLVGSWREIRRHMIQVRLRKRQGWRTGASNQN